MNLEMPVFGTAEYVIRRGALEYLTTMHKNRMALVVDSAALAGGKLERIQQMLSDADISYEIIADINREPFMQDLEEPIHRIQAYEPDCIVAIGGGSVMDTGKALWIFYEHPELTWEDAFKYFQIPPLGMKAPLVAVPTTSGTGSETTFVAVFADALTQSKHLIMSREIIPKIAILDADLLDSLPVAVAADSGMDALTHAMEGAVCTASSPMVISVALAACLDIFCWLPASVHPERYPGQKGQARERMHIAASMAGMTIANTCCGLAHAMDQIGPYFGLPHGLVCGILLPYTTKFLLPNDTYTLLARRMELKGSEEELGKQLVLRIAGLHEEIGLPGCFKAAGIDESEYLSKLDDFLDLGAESISTKLSPRIPDREQMKQIFLNAYYGAPLY